MNTYISGAFDVIYHSRSNPVWVFAASSSNNQTTPPLFHIIHSFVVTQTWQISFNYNEVVRSGPLFAPGGYVSSMASIVNYVDQGIIYYDYLVAAYDEPFMPYYAVFLTFNNSNFVLPANSGSPVLPNWYVLKKPAVGLPIKIFLQ